jgi:hypothetical protein
LDQILNDGFLNSDASPDFHGCDLPLPNPVTQSGWSQAQAVRSFLY